MSAGPDTMTDVLTPPAAAHLDIAADDGSGEMDTSAATLSFTTPPHSPSRQEKETEQQEDSQTTPAAHSTVAAPLLPPIDATQSAALHTADVTLASSSFAATSTPTILTSPTAVSSPPQPPAAAAAAEVISTSSTTDPTSTAPLSVSPPPSPQAARPARPSQHSDSEDTTVDSYPSASASASASATNTQPTRITVQLPRKTHADVVFYHLPTHRDALHHLSILRHIINASEHTDDNTAITYAQYAANPHTKKFYQQNLPLPPTLDPLPFTVRCLVRCLNRVSQQKKVVDVDHLLPSERSAHVYSTLRLQVIQLYGSHPPVYPFAPTMIAPSLPNHAATAAATAAVTTAVTAPSTAVVAPTAAAATTTPTPTAATSSSSPVTGTSPLAPTLPSTPSLPPSIPPEKQRPTDVVFFYLASYNDVMYHNSILSNVLHTIGQKDDKAYIPYSLYLASPRTTEHYPTGPPLPPTCNPIPFTLRGVLSCLARVRRQRRAQKTALTAVEPLERNGVVYARIREQVFRLYDGQPPSMVGLDAPKRSSSSGNSGGGGGTRRGSGRGGSGGMKRSGDDDERMDGADDDVGGSGSGSGSKLGRTSLARSVSASSDDSVPGSPSSSPQSSGSSEPDMLDHLLTASAAVNDTGDVKISRVKQRREAEKERRRKRMREGGTASSGSGGGGADGKSRSKEMKVKAEGDKSSEKPKDGVEKGAAGGDPNGKSAEKAENERERAERLYSKLSEHGALPDRDTFLKLWEACH